MSYRTLAINSAATALIGAATSVRIRANENGTIDIRPTDRASAVNLPKGEVLRPLGTKGSGLTVGLPAETLPTVEAGTVLELTAGKYGWFTLSSVQDLARGAPGGRVSAK